jgi:NAD(P)-dependent dehydrogenase (short-subunit alcohol dehydrogenase family)
MHLKNKIAIITGGGSGMGRATAVRLAELGVQVALWDVQLEKAQQLADSLKGIAIKCDVTKEDEVTQALQKVVAHYGQVHILVNCAGIVTGARVVGKSGPMPLEDFTRIIAVNLLGTFNVMRLVAAQMMAQQVLNEDGERGVIINTASIAAFEGQVGQAAYSAAKGGIVSMTLPVARELARYGIRVMAIAPGLIKTPMMEQMPDEVREKLQNATLFPKRLGHPEEFANLVVHIVENAYLNASVIRLDGAVRLSVG